MLDVLGTTLPSAVAIAISPLPIIAVILMLMSPRSKQLGLGFLLGWLVGVLVATTTFVLLAGAVPEPDASGGSEPVIGTFQLVLGALLLLLAVRQWRSRPAPGLTAELPSWMSKIDSMKPLAAIGLGFALAAVNPKNLMMAAAAGATIGRGSLDAGAMALTTVVFTVIAALSVTVPVLTAVAAPARAATVLAGIRIWLTANNATIMTILFIVLGAQLLGKGIASF